MSVQLPGALTVLPHYNRDPIIFVDIRPMYATPMLSPPPLMTV